MESASQRPARPGRATPSQQVNSLHVPVERHLQDGAGVATIPVSSRLVHRLRHLVLFVVSATPTCSSSPSPQLVHRLRHPNLFIVSVTQLVLFIVSLTPSCSSSPSRRLVHRLRHPVLFVVCVTPFCSSSPSPRLVHHLCHPVLFIVSFTTHVHCLRHSVLSVLSVAPYSFCIHTRSNMITISYCTCFSQVSNQVNSTYHSLDN